MEIREIHAWFPRMPMGALNICLSTLLRERKPDLSPLSAPL